MVGETRWYHTIELPGGVATPGYYDKRRIPGRVPLPDSLAGMRCLDVGTSDGFWAFEMERRGAEQVIAVDIDDPARYDWPQPRPPEPSRPANTARGPNPGFLIAHEALGSSVERVDSSVYELPSAGLGEFDFAFMGSLMLHLRDPIGALSAIRSVLRPGGNFLSVDSISVGQTVLHPFSAVASLHGHSIPEWWTPNLRGYRRMVSAAGFEIADTGGPLYIPFGRGFPKGDGSLLRLDRRTPGRIWFAIVTRRLGAASAWALCRPLPSR